MIQLIRGFKDILPQETPLWQHIEATVATLFEDFGFRQIRVPIMEKTDLFARSIGEDTDIVEKEMYTFPDRKGDLITLRPEATASIVRAFIQHKLHAQKPVHKLYTIGPMFRRERPQKGRYRQFYQIDAEIFGDGSPYEDVQLIFMLTTLLDRLAVSDTRAHINSLGCPSCRPNYKAGLQAFLADKTEALCADCQRRRERNPLRVLDCKVPGCREAVAQAPELIDYLCADCRSHFDAVQENLTVLGVPFELDKRLVRGLDYYTRTAFEIQTGALGAQSAVAGGGRYDGLVRALGGPDQPASGFAIGFDRLAEIVAMAGNDFQRPPALFVAALGEACRKRAFAWVCRLAELGVNAEMATVERSLKSQMKQANRLGAAWVLIFGEDEMARGEAVLRNMATRDQQEVPVAGMVDHLTAIIGR